jgi:hypothetical protein
VSYRLAALHTVGLLAMSFSTPSILGMEQQLLFHLPLAAGTCLYHADTASSPCMHPPILNLSSPVNVLLAVLSAHCQHF